VRLKASLEMSEIDKLHSPGQVTTLLFQAGIGPEATDLIMMLMEEK